MGLQTEEQYDVAVMMLDELLDEVGDDESHPSYEMLNILGILIANYECENGYCYCNGAKHERT